MDARRRRSLPFDHCAVTRPPGSLSPFTAPIWLLRIFRPSTRCLRPCARAAFGCWASLPRRSKHRMRAAWMARQIGHLAPAPIVNATAFSGKGKDGTTPLDAGNVPVFQVALTTTTTAMHGTTPNVVYPPPTWPCMWFCPKSMAACLQAYRRSKNRNRATTTCNSRAMRTRRTCRTHQCRG